MWKLLLRGREKDDFRSFFVVLYEYSFSIDISRFSFDFGCPTAYANLNFVWRLWFCECRSEMRKVSFEGEEGREGGWMGERERVWLPEAVLLSECRLTVYIQSFQSVAL